MDDIWAEDGEVPTEAQTARERFMTLGMREGLLQGSDTLLQDQFDKGYAEGAQLGIKYGRIIGILQHFAPELETEFVNEINEKSKVDFRQVDLLKWTQIADQYVK